MTDSHLPVIRCVSPSPERTTRWSGDACETVAICYRRDVVTVKCHKSLVKHRDYRFPSTIYAAACAINLSIVARVQEMLSNLEEGHLLCAHICSHASSHFYPFAVSQLSPRPGSVQAFFFLFVFFPFRGYAEGSFTGRRLICICHDDFGETYRSCRYQACNDARKLVSVTRNLILYQDNSIYFPRLLLANVWRKENVKSHEWDIVES